MIESVLFGCRNCFQAEPEQAWATVRNFIVLARLIEESHLIITLLACPQCGQRCVRVFTETIDWTRGEDPQYTSVVPVTNPESEQLLAQNEDAVALALETFGRGRRYLQMDFPSSGERRVGWAVGFVLGPHD